MSTTTTRTALSSVDFVIFGARPTEHPRWLANGRARREKVVTSDETGRPPTECLVVTPELTSQAHDSTYHDAFDCQRKDLLSEIEGQIGEDATAGELGQSMGGIVWTWRIRGSAQPE